MVISGLAFNLFGDLAADRARADRAVHTWWSDTPGTVSEVRFAHSPGRFDPSYLNSLRSFDAAFILDLGDGTGGIVAVDAKYHERMKPEIPKPSNLSRNHEVALRSGVFDERALSGPGKLCRALGIDTRLSGRHLFEPDAPLTLRPGPPPAELAVTRRIGINVAQARRLRFCDPASPAVSAARPAGISLLPGRRRAKAPRARLTPKRGSP